MARALVLAGLAQQPTTLLNPLVARDSLLMAQALRALGASVHSPDEGCWQVTPGTAAVDGAIDCGLAGTVMRFVPPMAALTSVDIGFDGDERSRARPLSGLLDAMRGLGVRLSPEGAASLPFVVHGTGAVAGGAVSVDARESSQFVSGLLLAGCRFGDGLDLTATGVPPSAPHVAMTLASLRARGVDAHAVGATRWRVAPAVPTGGQVTIEPDLSNAAPFLAAAVVTGGRVRVPDWPSVTTQPGPTLLGLLSRFGAVVEQHDQAVTVTGPEQVAGLGEVDLSEVGELTPAVAAMAALAQQPTTITGVAHLRGHETDRLAALTRALRALGGTVQPTPDGLHIVPSRLSGATVASEGDHRMATFAAIVGLAVPGVVVDDVTVTAKTMPSFTALWRDMLT